jgi:hypothetical protein
LAPIAPDALDRWTYRKDGMDYGPFSTRDILDLLRKRALTSEMEVCNRKTRKWQKVSEVPRFAAFLAAEAEETKRQEIEREVTALERTITAKRKMPALLLLVIGVVVASVFYILLRPAAPVLAGYPAAFFRNPPIERLPLYLADDIARMKAAALPKPVEAPKPVRKVVRRTSSGAEVTEIGPGSADMGIEVDLSDSGPVEGGRTLSSEDLDQVQRRASPALIRCFRDEAARRPGFRGGTVSLYLLNSGSVKVSRVSTSPAPSPELAACARGATGGIHVQPYTGPAQVMELPIYVSEVR